MVVVTVVTSSHLAHRTDLNAPLSCTTVLPWKALLNRKLPPVLVEHPATTSVLEMAFAVVSPSCNLTAAASHSASVLMVQ